MATTDDIFFTNKIAELEHWSRQDQKNNTAYVGYVNSVSPLHRLSGAYIVYVPQLLAFLKCEASAGYNGTYMGSTLDYRPGDRVLVSFVNGKTERPVIIGSLPTHANEPSLLSGDIPTPDSISSTPNAVIPGAARYGFNVQGQAYPLVASTDLTGVLPGTAVASTPDGVYSIWAAKGIRLAASYVNHEVTAPAVDPVLLPFTNATDLAKMWEYSVAMGSPNQLDNLNSYGISTLTLNDPLLQTAKIIPFDPQQYLDEAQLESESFQHLEKCLGSNNDAATTFFNKVFDLAKDAALEELNQLLPPWLRTSIRGDELTVGPLAVDQKTGQIGFNGQVFSAAVGSQLSKVNKVLPSWLGISLTPSSIGIGDNNVYLDDLLNGPKEIGDISVVTEGDDVLIKMGDTNLVNITGGLKDLARGALTQPLSSLNQQLPEGLDADVTFDAAGNPTVKVGPLSITPTGNGSGIQLDQKALGKLVDNYATGVIDSATKQLPKPVQILAQMAWEELDLGSLFLDKAADSNSVLEESAIIKSATYSCGTELNIPTGAPPVIEPADYTNKTDYEVDTNGQTLPKYNV